jgi:hypothetical protein
MDGRGIGRRRSVSVVDDNLQPQLFHRTIEERWREFDQQNPVVYEMLESFAREVHRRGVRKIGIRLLWERMRWEILMTTKDPTGYKLNDHYTALYARKLVKEHPEWATLFELRRRRTP